MLRKLLPKRLKAYIRSELLRHVQADLRDFIPGREGYLPHEPQSRNYIFPRTLEESATSLAIPPSSLWAGYGSTVEEYLASGRNDVQTLRELLLAADAPIENSQRILEFGCAGGRMVRWLRDLVDVCEIWGTDISASHALWCQQHLNPPFHFATTTIYPHLPFEDRYFGLVFAGSVFTHIDDLADAWFLELRRVLRPHGRLYLSIHDRTTVRTLDGKDRDHSLAKRLRGVPDYERFSRSDFGMFTIGRSVNSQVFYDIGFLCRRLEPFFRVNSVTPEAYYYQTVVLLERL
jgi:SAM-dependent methyltransferase